MKSIADVKHAMHAVEETRQITKAMHLISTSKVRKALNMYAANRTYFERVQATMKDILMRSKDITHPFLGKPKGGRAAYLIIAADKGLCGGYNHNVLKFAQGFMRDSVNPYIVTVGQETGEYFARRGKPIDDELQDRSQSPTLHNGRRIMNKLLPLYSQGIVDEIYIIYTEYVSPTVQQPCAIRLLPLDADAPEFLGVQPEVLDNNPITYYPDAKTVFDNLIPQFMVGIVYGAMVQSYASEQSARMTAMDSANRNGEEMLDKYRMEMNRARQSAVTSDIAEIIGALEVLK